MTAVSEEAVMEEVPVAAEMEEEVDAVVDAAAVVAVAVEDVEVKK